MVRASDILGLLGKQDTHVCLCHVGGGGNSKPLLSAFRRNVFSDTRKYIPSTCFENEEERRKQGINFAFCRAATIQEAPATTAARGDLLKNAFSGGEFPVGPNCGKAPDALKLDSMTRRSRIVDYFSTFEADPAKVNVQEKRFEWQAGTWAARK
ncbi:unnamed protein product [Prorocentrum cordatum]|uniref:Uncharacterized protein n=1 Tax=Prorocentrum cordatum TaxID=2364126 RepID=A0ABN9RNG0_9DINO|nr:unnamed protein product [Polarella glacialis]